MRKSLAFLLLLAPACLAMDAPQRHTVPAGVLKRVEPGVLPAGAQIGKRPPKAAAKAALGSYGQALGVVQINNLDPARPAWFVTTGTLAAGSTLQFALHLQAPDPDGQTLNLGAVTISQDIPAGYSLDLPKLGNGGALWPDGVVTYYVFVTDPGGVTTQAAGDFCVCAGRGRTFEDLTNIAPLLFSAVEVLGTDNNVSLRVDATVFQGLDPFQIAINDLVVPQSAISFQNPSFIVINLSQVPGANLEHAWDALLTISEDGWADTIPVRHVPYGPGTYNPAP